MSEWDLTLDKNLHPVIPVGATVTTTNNHGKVRHGKVTAVSAELMASGKWEPWYIIAAIGVKGTLYVHESKVSRSQARK